jgi:hypothetical protein
MVASSDRDCGSRAGFTEYCRGFLVPGEVVPL